MSPDDHNGVDHGVKLKDISQSSQSASAQKKNAACKIASSSPQPKSGQKEAMKLDLACSMTLDEACYIYQDSKHFKDQAFVPSFISALRTELMRAQLQIQKLEAERQYSKKKLKDLLRKLTEERTLWRTRVHQKMRMVVSALKDELIKEKKNCLMLEILNSKLVRELADVNLHVTRFMEEYKEQKRAKELLEEVCNELAKQLEEDKAEFEALRKESVKLQEEVEDERNMLQLAAMWREERVQMKLTDAKSALEDKYSQIKELVNVLTSVLRSKSATLDAMDLRSDELISRMVKSINIQDIEEFTYEPSKSGDIFSIFEEINQCQANETMIETSESKRAEFHYVRPDENHIAGEPSREQLNVCRDYKYDFKEEAQGSETVTHAEHQNSITCLEVKKKLSTSSIQKRLRIRTEEESIGDDCSNILISEQISEVSSGSAKQPKQRTSSASKLSESGLNENTFCEELSAEEDSLVSNMTVSSLEAISPSRKSCQDSLKQHNSAAQCLQDLANPHITRAMNGRIEWPRVIRKTTLQNKTKPLAAKLESQKSQLRTILKRRA